MTLSSSSTRIEPLWALLPQPSDPSSAYNYVAYDEVAAEYFDTTTYEKDQLVWVLSSSGRRGKKKSEMNDDSGNKDGATGGDDGACDGAGEDERGVRTHLFLRARVVSDPGYSASRPTGKQQGGSNNSISSNSSKKDEEPRVLVRYPKGSTYNVRRSFIIPVLESGVVNERIVVVAPETNEYRRTAVVHSCVGESFLEIGCDFGPCVDRVRKALTQIPAVPMHSAGKNSTEPVGKGPGKVSCLGIDKAPESIEVATKR